MSGAAMTTGFAFPTTGLAALPSGGAFPSDGGVGDISEFGCPLSDFVSLESVCSATNIPSCAAAQITGTGDPFSVTYDAACCTSLSAFGESVASCYSKHAPTCLDTSALLASATDDSSPDETDIASFSDPCAQYFGNGGAKAGGAAATPAPSAKGGSSGGATVTGSAGGATNSAASGGSSSAVAGSGKPNAAPAAKSVGLKVWIGVVGLGALGVLAL